MKHFVRMFAASAGILMVLGSASAQHTLAAKFDTTKSISVSGMVTRVDWGNPNAHIIMKVPGSTPNSPVVWAVELDNPIMLTRNGWSPTALKSGDLIKVDGSPARDGSKQVTGKNVVLNSTGKSVYIGMGPAPVKPPAPLGGATPRWPDGHPRLGPEPGQTGYWGNPSRTALIQDGATVQMDAYGLLRNVSDASKVAPMQKWALDVYSERQRNFLANDPMFLYCKPPGGPRVYQQPFGVQFVENLANKRIVLLQGGANRNTHIIYMDGRKQVGQRGGDDDNPLYYGRSVGKWEKDTLIVDVIGYNEKFWFDNGGLPHTDKLHLVEKYTRTDMNTMKYEVTIDDPGAYTKTWTASWTLQWIPGEETPYFLCQDNRP